MENFKSTPPNFILIIICIGLMSSNLYAQNNTNNTYTFWNAEMQAIAKPESKPGWIYFKDNFNTPVQDIFTTHAGAFGLGSGDEMALVKTKTDGLGWTHYWFQQYHNGILVLHKIFVIHKKGSVVKGNGDIEPLLNISNVTPSIPFTTAKNIAQTNLGSSIVHVENNGLIIYTENNSLCYHFDAHSDSISKEFIINAQNSNIELILDAHCNYQVSHEQFYGPTYCREDSVSIANVTIDTNYLPGGYEIYDTATIYELIDTGRRVRVYGQKKIIPVSGSPQFPVDIFKFDGHLPNIGICDFDYNKYRYAASNAYWATQNVYDILRDMYDTTLFNGNNYYTILTEANDALQFSEPSIGYLTALNTYGIKVGNEWCNIQIVSHEWGHAINRGLGANMIYSSESGMLAEGFSDIFGIFVQEYMSSSFNLGIDDPDWVGNTELGIDKRVNRSKANPKAHATGYSQTGVTGFLYLPHPDYYKGQNWQGTNYQYNKDPIHHNSTVFSHWYYLISEGGTKTNEVGDTYNLMGIGMDNAIDIVMYAMMNGLVTPNTDFLGMRRATIDATINIYGYCEALKTVIDAWDAVGVYDTLFNGFISPNTYVYYEINNTNFNLSDTVYILGNLTVNNSTLNINNAIVFLSPFAKILVNPNSNLNITGSNFNCGLYSAIDIMEDANFFSTTSSYQFDSTICFSVDTFYNLWQGINFKAGNNSTIDFIRNNMSGAFCGIYAHNTSNSFNPRTNIQANNFINNMKALYITGSSLPANTTIPLNIVRNNYFDTPWKKNTTGIPPLPISAEYGSFLLKSYVQFDNIKNMEVISNTFGNLNIPPITAYPLPSNYTPYIPISGTGVYSPPVGTIKANLGIDLNSTTTDVEYVLRNNRFYKTSVPLQVNCQGNSQIIKNEFIKNISVSYGAPFIKSFDGSLFIDSCIFSEGGVGMFLVNSENCVISNNTFNKTYQNIYLQAGSNNAIKNNVFTNMLNSNQFEGFGIHNYGSESCIIEGNSFNETTNYGSQYGIIMNNVGNAPSYIFNNSFAQLNYAVQTDEMNTGLKIKCNKFATNGIAHLAGIFAIDGYLANQGASCNNTGNNWQAGNEWIDNTTSNTNSLSKDILLGPNMQAFEYWAHGFNTLTGNNNTNPLKHNYPINTTLLNICNGIQNTYKEKNNTSCVDIYDGWHRPIDINEDLLIKLTDLINIRTNHINELSTLESMLYNPDTQHDIVEKIKYYQQEIKLVNEGIIEIYKKTGNDVALTALLESDNSIEAKQKLYEQYLEKKDYINAARVLNEMQQTYNPDYFYANAVELQKNEDNKNYFANIAEIENQIRIDKRKISELNEAEIQTLRTIKQANLPVSAKAEVLLAYNGDTLYQHAIKKLSTQTMDSLLSGVNGFNYNLTLTPNPATTQVEVCFALPNNAQNIKLSLIDEYNHVGLLLDEKSIGEQEICKTFNTTAYTNGTYRVVLEHDEAVQAGKHLLIIR